MLAPLSWLRDFAPFGDDVQALADTFDDLGMVVEGVRRVGEGLDDLVVARVEAIAGVPGADRIRKVSVDTGSGSVDVVCGAFNFSVGALVAFAPVGSVLPDGTTIARRRVKGVVSNGMLCSPAELGLSEDHDGILVLGAGVEAGQPLVSAPGAEPDVVFDMAIETNRPDAMCILGIARDAAARLGLPLVEPSFGEGKARVGELASLSVEADDLCPRFLLSVFAGVEVGESPGPVRRRLTLAGMRPINSVVDASNYVMLELGQPNHAYDMHRVAGPGLLVRAARPGETLVTLDGELRRLGVGLADGSVSRDCLICDAQSEPVGIAGIMGSESSEIGPKTSAVLLETAYFDPMAVARTSRRLGLRTEASSRFERGCDPEALERAARRFAELLGGTAAPIVQMLEGGAGVPPRTRLALRTSRVNRMLGTTLDEAAIRGYLEPLGFRLGSSGDGVQQVVVPSFRPDTTREIDVIEEVGRHHGYSRIAPRVPVISQVGGLTPAQRTRRRLRAVVAGCGAHEVWTATLIGPHDHGRAGLGSAGLEVENPLAAGESVLRRSLLPGLLRVLAYNGARRQGDVRVFEVGHVFEPPAPGAELPDEREQLAVALAWPGDGAEEAVRLWRVVADQMGLAEVHFEAREVAGLHRTRSGSLLVPGAAEIGQVGEVDPQVTDAFGCSGGRVGWLCVDLAGLGAAPRSEPSADRVSRYPSADMDLAFVVEDTVPAGAVGATLREVGGELVERVELFDVYRGPGVDPGSRGLGFHLRFCAPDHTLTEGELSELRLSCIAGVERGHAARLRA